MTNLPDSSAAPIPALVKAQWQTAIFSIPPRRAELRPLKPTWALRTLRINIHRNMPFEFVAEATKPFLAYAGFAPAYVIGAYDDSLGFADWQKAECEFVWLDFTRFAALEKGKMFEWLKSRLETLRAKSSQPILIADGGGLSAELNEGLAKIIEALPGCHIFPRGDIEQRLGDTWIDKRMQNVSATSMSDIAVLTTAQSLGLVWFPATTTVPLKALVLDLDQTLYKGVLGEDGIDGVTLTDDHKRLQEKLLDYKKKGLFLAVLSRNEQSDVEALFQKRRDFPLAWADFSAASIGWQDKSEGLKKIAEQLRIHPDSMLVLDDNPGEIAHIAHSHPTTSFLHAENTAQAIQALDLFPRLMRVHQDATDALRAADLDAEKTRTALKDKAEDPKAYMASLEIILNFYANPADQLSRLADLANKTNKFILSFARFTEADVAARLKDKNAFIVSIALKDKLSDSGIIAAVFLKLNGQAVHVEEICVSCRALGRGVENAMIAEALRHALDRFNVDKLALTYKKGPRNQPALDWLTSFAQTKLAEETGTVSMTKADLQRHLVPLPIRISWEEKAS